MNEAAITGVPAPVASSAASLEGTHREALQYIERVTACAGETQHRVLAEILAQNAPAEYLRRIGVSGETPGAAEAFRLLAPLTTYEDILPDVTRIANGDRSPILSGKPIREFLTRCVSIDRSSCMCMAMQPRPCVCVVRVQLRHVGRGEEADADDRGGDGPPVGAVQPVHAGDEPVDAGAGQGQGHVPLLCQGGVAHAGRAAGVFSSVCRSPTTSIRAHIEAILCVDEYQSMYAQLLCGLIHRDDVLRIGLIFASGFLRAIRFLEKHWPRLCQDIRTGTLDAEITDNTVRAAVERVLRADPALADAIEAECARPSWESIISRVWPNTKYIEVIVTGSMAQYIPTLEFYGGDLPLVSPGYGSSECALGLNLNPMCKPSDVAYTLIPTMCYFEFLPVHSGSNAATAKPDQRGLVDLVDVELGHEYELVLTTYSGLYRYRVGDVLRVAGFKNKAPMFNFVGRKDAALSIDMDKTGEAELHAAVTRAAQLLEPFGASLVDYTSYTDMNAIPGHYVLFWELRAGETAVPVPASAFEDCCLTVEESLNSVYRQYRQSHSRTIGHLEIRVVSEGTFDMLMDYALSRGVSINQYKAPRCVRPGPVVELLDGRAQARYFSPKPPKWSSGNKQWSAGNAEKTSVN